MVSVENQEVRNKIGSKAIAMNEGIKGMTINITSLFLSTLFKAALLLFIIIVLK